MISFQHTGLPCRVIFGPDSTHTLASELTRAGIARPLLICSRGGRGRADSVMKRAAVAPAAVFDDARMHVPAEVVHAATQIFNASDADGAVAVGGGSATGLAKVLARAAGCPYLAIPTTYSGSEMTPIWGCTEQGRKRTGRDPRVLPRAVIYDPVLTVGLPVAVAAPSGINAMAHAVEALYGQNANPATDAIAEQAIRLLGHALPRIVAQPDDLDARGRALCGAWLAGLTLASVDMGLHHKLCHILGGACGLDHAGTHTAVLPHTLNYNRRAAPGALAVVARALEKEDAPLALYELATDTGAPRSLKDLGMQADRLDEMADLAASAACSNPEALTRSAIRALLEDAWCGRAPTR